MFIDINYWKSDSFSAYWFLPKVKLVTFNRKHKWFKKENNKTHDTIKACKNKVQSQWHLGKQFLYLFVNNPFLCINNIKVPAAYYNAISKFILSALKIFCSRTLYQYAFTNHKVFLEVRSCISKWIISLQLEINFQFWKYIKE